MVVSVCVQTHTHKPTNIFVKTSIHWHYFGLLNLNEHIFIKSVTVKSIVITLFKSVCSKYYIVHTYIGTNTHLKIIL